MKKFKELPCLKHCFLGAVAALSSMTLSVNATYFSDVPDSASYSEACDFLYLTGLSQGDSNGNFKPDSNITRGEFAVMLLKVADLSTSGSSSTYSDVPTTHWANAFVTAVAKQDLMTGFSDHFFGVESSLTLQDACTILTNVLGLRDTAMSLGGYPNGFVSAIRQAGGLEGVTTASDAYISRKDVAILLDNLLKKDMSPLFHSMVGYWDCLSNKKGSNSGIELANVAFQDNGFFLGIGWLYSEIAFSGTVYSSQARKLQENVYEIPILRNMTNWDTMEGWKELELVTFDFGKFAEQKTVGINAVTYELYGDIEFDDFAVQVQSKYR